jgi:hypothetical protein
VSEDEGAQPQSSSRSCMESRTAAEATMVALGKL